MSRNEVSSLLQDWSLRNFLSRRPPATVVTLQTDTTLVEALASFARSRIVAAPVIDKGSLRYIGFLDLLDLVKSILSWFPSKPDPSQLRKLLERAETRLQTTTVAEVPFGTDTRLVYHAKLDTNLLEVVREGFLNPAAAGRPCHRLAVFEYDPEYVDPQDAAAGVQFTSIVSQSDLAAFLHQHSQQLGGVLGVTLEQLGVQEGRVVCVPDVMPTIHAFRAVMDSQVGCAGVVDSHGVLVGQLSTSDLRGLLPQHVPRLGLPVREFLGQSLEEGGGVAPSALAQTYGVRSPRARSRELRCPSTSPQVTLGEVLGRVVVEHLHRVFVVDEGGRPSAVLTLTDILTLMVAGGERVGGGG